jgi:hypothetical protein
LYNLSSLTNLKKKGEEVIVENQAKIVELSEFNFGRGITPKGSESDFIEIVVQKPAGGWNLFQFSTIVTITGYLYDDFEVIVKWKDDEKDEYKDNQKVIDLVSQGKNLILDKLRIMSQLNLKGDELYEEMKRRHRSLSSIEFNSLDRQGNDLFISIDGVDDKILTLFSGLDLQMKAVKHLIHNTVRSDIDQEKGGDFAERKMFALYLNEIGELMRNLSTDSQELKEISNMDLVKHFMNHWQEDRVLIDVVEKDNEEIRKETEKYMSLQKNRVN